LTLIFFRDGRKSLESVKYNNYTVHGLENCLFLAESKFFNNCIFVSIIVQQRDPVSRPSSRYIFCFFCIFSGESVQLLHLLSNFCFCCTIRCICCTIRCICCTIRCISWNTITSVAIQHDDIYLLYIVLFFWVHRHYEKTLFLAYSTNFRKKQPLKPTNTAQSLPGTFFLMTWLSAMCYWNGLYCQDLLIKSLRLLTLIITFHATLFRSFKAPFHLVTLIYIYAKMQ